MNTAESTPGSGTNGQPQTKGTDMRGKNWLVMIATLLVIGLSGIVMNGCESANQIQDGENKDMNVGEEDDGGEKLLGNEIDNIPRVLKKGDTADEIVHPITGARAYEKMEQDPENPYGLLSRVIVEYQGQNDEMQPVSSIVEFSPNGKYLLYLAWLTSNSQAGTFLYNVETGTTQELIPSVAEDDPRFIPGPGGNVTWSGSTITYEARGKTRRLTFEEE